MPFTQPGPNAKAFIGTFIDVIINQSTDEIKNLYLAQASRKDYQKRKKNGLCFEGTRVAIVGEMTDWVTNPGESRMYTLSGLAGIGKSTVAYTVATKADERGLLGASFFFTRDDIDCRTVQKFFTTLVYQLCHHDEEIKNVIRDVLTTERGAAAAKGTPQEQLEALILDPLRWIAGSRTQPILVVVDALDECDDDDVPSVLEGLRRMVQDLPSFKIILTTRPKPFVGHYFATLRGYKNFHLQDIEDKVVNGDIRLYLKHSLSHEQVIAYLQDPTEEWYASDAEVELLVHAAGKLFIIASTAVRFILDRHWSDPSKRMKMLLVAFAQNRIPFGDLSHFYTTILRSAIPTDCCDKDLVERYQIVVGIIVIIRVPVPVDTLASLSGIDAKQISVVLRQLQSVIQVGADNIPIIYHKSFSDFITDQACCKDVNLRIDLTIRNTWIVIRCFEIMNGHLQYNILGLDGPARFMNNKEGLAYQGISDNDLKERISAALHYTCVYWANHLESAKINDAGLMKELEVFANAHMLHWFEALSLIGRLDSAQGCIRVALTLMKPTTSDLFQLLSDGWRFISKFYEIVERSALHTYYSALPFTPTESLLYRRYIKQAADTIFRVMVGPEQWDALLTTRRHGNPNEPPVLRMFSVDFSLDSAMFASWDQERVRFWDAATGTPISTISLNSHDIVIANDFSTIASAEANIITLYSVKTSAPVATFTTSAEIWGLALASESSRVAASLSDGTLCLWDTGKSEPIASFGGLNFGWCTLTFSRTGARLAYMAHRGGIIQLRDGITGTLITDLDDPSKERHQLVFSHDGSRFAVLTEEGLRLWKSESGELVGVATLHAPEHRLAISTNGSLLATGFAKKLQIWSGNSRNPLPLIDELKLGSDDVGSLAFSPDDILAYTTSNKNITMFDVRSRSVIFTLPILPVGSLTFSPDWTRLAGMDNYCVVHLWDVQGTRAPSPSSKQDTKRIRSLALSQGGVHLACLFEDNAVELWAIGGAKRRIPIHGGQDGQHVYSILVSPDGKKLAAAFSNGTIKFWNGENGVSTGSIESIEYSERPAFGSPTVALSNRALVVGGHNALALWDVRTLRPIGTVGDRDPYRLAFSDNGDLLAYDEGRRVPNTLKVLDVMKCTVINTFEVDYWIDRLAFASDDSQLVVQFTSGEFQLFNLAKKEFADEPVVIGLHHIPHLDTTPSERRLERWFPQHEDPVPVLRIPKELQIVEWAQGSSTIACSDGQVIFVLSPNTANRFVEQSPAVSKQVHEGERRERSKSAACIIV